MKRLTTLALTGIVSMLASTLVNALPIASGSLTLDSSSTKDPIQIFEIDATGYGDLTLAFSVIGLGSIDACDGRYNQDCLSVGTNHVDLVSGLNITRDWQDFGPLDLAINDTVFGLVFTGRVSGGDEGMSINWDISGSTYHDFRVLAVSEPGILALLALGLIGCVAARRRSV